jgi:hypothetical protein
MMKPPRKLIVGTLVAMAVLVAGLSVYAQVKRPYRNGSVWEIAFIRMKPGMETAYLTYLTRDWKREQEALKSAGLIVSYKVLGTEGHNSGDWNLMLMTEYKDLASMEAGEQKSEAIAQTVVGDDLKMQQGYKDRLEIREIIETLARRSSSSLGSTCARLAPCRKRHGAPRGSHSRNLVGRGRRHWRNDSRVQPLRATSSVISSLSPFFNRTVFSNVTAPARSASRAVTGTPPAVALMEGGVGSRTGPNASEFRASVPNSRSIVAAADPGWIRCANMPHPSPVVKNARKSSGAIFGANASRPSGPDQA